MELIDYGAFHWFEEKFGGNTDVDTTNAETMWDGGGLYPWPAAAESLEILGVAADTGITVSVSGLDANYALQTKSVATDASDGTTPVAIDGTWIRVFRVKVTDGTTTDDLTVRVAGAGATRAIVTHPNYQTLMAVFTVPAGFNAKITSYYGVVEESKDAIISLFVRPFGEVFQLKGQISVFETYIKHKFDTPIQFSEKADIDLRAISRNINTEVFGGFSLLMLEQGVSRRKVTR